MPVYMGSQRIKELYVGGQRIKTAHIWDGSTWQRVHTMPTAAARVNKSGNQVLGSGYDTPTGWTLASGTGGVAHTNGLRVSGFGTVSVSAQVTTTGVFTSAWLQILRNGVQVGVEATAGSGTTITASASGVAVTDGDVIGLSFRSGGIGDGPRTVVGGTGTYIQITAA